MRVPIELFQRLESLAADRDESVSQAARRLLNDGLAPAGRNAIDDAIATLLSVRDQLSVPSATGPAVVDGDGSPRPAPKKIDVLNAKTDLQHLLADVARGDQFVITHAGAPRARLVAVDETGPLTRSERNR